MSIPDLERIDLIQDLVVFGTASLRVPAAPWQRKAAGPYWRRGRNGLGS